ncbi:MAG: Fe-S cluster assembly ATPase SufC [Bacilli bacterium]|nr:Fe-S cluster assembly ATPase SufC [Bacilli bacterium]
MLKINNLEVNVDNKQIINNLNLDIKNGEIHVLMGPNGVGKSSITKVLLRDKNYNVLNGNISYNDEDLLTFNTTEASRKGIYLVNQNPLQIEGITTAELLRTSLNEQNKKLDIFEFSKELDSLCKELEIPKSYVHRDINVGMSGGEKKKIELLHMWMLKPKFIILDEVDSGLDVDAIRVVSESINKYYEMYKPSILIITHHTNILEYIKPNYVHVMVNGKISESGDITLAERIENEGFNSLKGTNIVSGNDLSE